MVLTNAAVAKFIQEVWENDYFRFELMSSSPVVTHFERDGNSITVDYEFWDDGSYASDSQDNFLFDIDIANEYGCNFPANMQFVKMKDKFTWHTSEDCENLSPEPSQEDHLDTNITTYNWGDPETEEMVSSYFNLDMMGIEHVRDMLIEKYDAKHGLPEFIPERLKEFFQKVLSIE